MYNYYTKYQHITMNNSIFKNQNVLIKSLLNVGLEPFNY